VHFNMVMFTSRTIGSACRISVGVPNLVDSILLTLVLRECSEFLSVRILLHFKFPFAIIAAVWCVEHHICQTLAQDVSNQPSRGRSDTTERPAMRTNTTDWLDKRFRNSPSVLERVPAGQRAV